MLLLQEVFARLDFIDGMLRRAVRIYMIKKAVFLEGKKVAYFK